MFNIPGFYDVDSRRGGIYFHHFVFITSAIGRWCLLGNFICKGDIDLTKF